MSPVEPIKPRRGLPRQGVAQQPDQQPVSAPPPSAESPSAATSSAAPPLATPALDAPPPASPGGGRRGLPRPTSTAADTPASTAGSAAASPATETPSAPASASPGPSPAARATGPHVAATKTASPFHLAKLATPQLRRAALVTLGAVVLLAALILLAQWFVSLPFMREFLATYPGETPLPETAPAGLPAWIGWQHFLSAFLMVLIIRSGWQVRTTKRPAGTWVRKNTVLKTRNPPKKINLELWFHLTVDSIWLVNGIVFVVLLFATGQWMRVVPTTWAIIPNAISAGLQYLSLDWPTENGWVNYNSLQVLAYFATIFIAAPLAALTGVRMLGAWPRDAQRLNAIYPIELARAVHFPVMLYFVGFIVVHVTLVLATGALRNLNHMYGAQDAVNWTGFWIFAASLVVMVAAVFAARPFILRPIAALMGTVGR